MTNYVTVNECANITFAIGALPIMSDDIDEVVATAKALVLNVGALNKNMVNAMVAAGQKANALKVPVILNPLGVGVSNLRRKAIMFLLKNINISIICGRSTEINFINELEGKNNEHSCSVEMVKGLAKKYNAIVALVGPSDIISDGDKVICIDNGHESMATVIGSGCMCTSLVGVFCGASDNYLKATVSAVATMAISGEIAYEKINTYGCGSYGISIIDEVNHMNPQKMLERMKIYKI